MSSSKSTLSPSSSPPSSSLRRQTLSPRNRFRSFFESSSRDSNQSEASSSRGNQSSALAPSSPPQSSAYQSTCSASTSASSGFSFSQMNQYSTSSHQSDSHPRRTSAPIGFSLSPPSSQTTPIPIEIEMPSPPSSIDDPFAPSSIESAWNGQSVSTTTSTPTSTSDRRSRSRDIQSLETGLGDELFNHSWLRTDNHSEALIDESMNNQRSGNDGTNVSETFRARNYRDRESYLGNARARHTRQEDSHLRQRRFSGQENESRREDLNAASLLQIGRRASHVPSQSQLHPQSSITSNTRQRRSLISDGTEQTSLPDPILRRRFPFSHGLDSSRFIPTSDRNQSSFYLSESNGQETSSSRSRDSNNHRLGTEIPSISSFFDGGDPYFAPLEDDRQRYGRSSTSSGSKRNIELVSTSPNSTPSPYSQSPGLVSSSSTSTSVASSSRISGRDAFLNEVSNTGLNLGRGFDEGREVKLSEGLGLDDPISDEMEVDEFRVGRAFSTDYSSSSRRDQEGESGESSSRSHNVLTAPRRRSRAESNKRQRSGTDSNSIGWLSEDTSRNHSANSLSSSAFSLSHQAMTNRSQASSNSLTSRFQTNQMSGSSSLSLNSRASLPPSNQLSTSTASGPRLAFPPALGNSSGSSSLSDGFQLSSFLDEIENDEGGSGASSRFESIINDLLRDPSGSGSDTRSSSTQRPAFHLPSPSPSRSIQRQFSTIRRSPSNSTISSFSTTTATDAGTGTETESSSERNGVRELRAAISRSRRLRERLEEGEAVRRSVEGRREIDINESQSLSDSRTSNESDYYRRILDLARGSIELASDAIQIQVGNRSTESLQIDETPSSAPQSIYDDTSRDIRESNRNALSYSGLQPSRSSLSLRLADLQTRVQENMRELEDWQGRNESLLSQIRTRNLNSESNEMRADVEREDPIERRRRIFSSLESENSLESPQRSEREREEGVRAFSSATSISSGLVGMSVASRRRPALSSSSVVQPNSHETGSSSSLWGEISRSNPITTSSNQNLSSSNSSTLDSSFTRSLASNNFTSSSRRDGTLDGAGRLRGPTRRANEEWLGLGASTRDRDGLIALSRDRDGDVSSTGSIVSWRDRYLASRHTPSAAAFISPEERRRDSSEQIPPEASNSSTLPSLPSLRSRSPFSLNFAEHASQSQIGQRRRVSAPVNQLSSTLPELDDLLNELEDEDSLFDMVSERRQRRFGWISRTDPSSRMTNSSSSAAASGDRDEHLVGGSVGEQISSRLLARSEALDARLEFLRNRRRAPVSALHDQPSTNDWIGSLDDDDATTYESLLRLSASLDEAYPHIPRSISARALSKLPRCIYKDWNGRPMRQSLKDGKGKSKAPEKDSNCSICLDEYSDSDTLMSVPCDHVFHEKCLLTWLGNNKTCPMCRASAEEETSFESLLPELL